MSEIKTDKKVESISALKNANKHLADLFAEIDKKDITLKTCANDLAHAARKCGDLLIETWVGSNKQIITLKTYLETIVSRLNEARS